MTVRNSYFKINSELMSRPEVRGAISGFMFGLGVFFLPSSLQGFYYMFPDSYAIFLVFLAVVLTASYLSIAGVNFIRKSVFIKISDRFKHWLSIVICAILPVTLALVLSSRI